jgi:N-acetylmuramoyl-L-alanine amidase
VKPLIQLLLVVLALVASAALAEQATVQGARIAPAADKTRLVLDASGPVGHRIFALQGPDRLVLDIADARLVGKLPKAGADDPSLAGLRSGVRDGDDLRIVLDLKQSVRVKSFLLGPEQGHGHRLVVDLIPKGTGKAGARLTERAASAAVLAVSAEPAAVPLSRRTRAARPLVVAIDAGHGGQDPGATGARGTREKDVTLAIARRLAALVAREPGMRPVLIRDGDYFIPLRARILKARKHEADIFISIHADAFDNREARGSSVFTLSERGASSEAAKWLADRENSADLVGGVDLGEGDDVLANVLLSMSQNATLEHSGEVAKAVLANLSQLGATHKAQVQKAGFVVLKSPDIPSVLVETAFISNPQEESRLVNPANQQRLAEAILAGVKAYFRKYRPQSLSGGQSVAGGAPGHRHVIGRGDTLAEIAKRYRVPLSDLRAANRLSGNEIRVGQVLTIPGG